MPSCSHSLHGEESCSLSVFTQAYNIIFINGAHTALPLPEYKLIQTVERSKLCVHKLIMYIIRSTDEEARSVQVNCHHLVDQLHVGHTLFRHITQDIH